MPVENIEAELKLTYLGDVEIGGIYIGLALKFLSDLGYDWEPTMMEGNRVQSMEVCVGDYLIEIPGHALLYKDSQIWDNTYNKGCKVREYERRAERIVRAYRITR